MAERNVPGAPSARLQSVRQAATRIFSHEEQRFLPILRGSDSYNRAGLAQALGVEESLAPHLMVELGLLLCVNALDVNELGRIPDVLKKNDGILNGF